MVKQLRGEGVMTVELTVRLTPEQASQLVDKAVSNGLSLNEYVHQQLTRP